MSMILGRREWTEQPPDTGGINWANPLVRDAEFVILGSQKLFNPTSRAVTYTGAITQTLTRGGSALSVSPANYLVYPLPSATGGTGPWTIAGVYVPSALPTAWATSGAGIAGSCDGPGSTTRDRSVGFASTTNAWRGYLYDGATKFADSSAVPVVGKPDTVIVTCDGANLVCAVAGYPDATVAVSNTGFNGYTAAKFCVGHPDDLLSGGATTGVVVLIRTNAAWTASMRESFKANPWQILEPQTIRIPQGIAAGGGAVTGTLASTLAGVTLSAAGSVAVTGSLSATLAGVTTVSAGAVAVSGTAAKTLDGATLASTATVAVTGSLSATLAGATLAATGSIAAANGSAAIQLAGATLQAAGTVAVTGSVSATLESATLSAAGAVAVTGSLSATLAGATLSAAGSGPGSGMGTLGVQLDGASLSAIGSVAVIGRVAAQLDGVVIVARGTQQLIISPATSVPHTRRIGAAATSFQTPVIVARRNTFTPRRITPRRVTGD